MNAVLLFVWVLGEAVSVWLGGLIIDSGSETPGLIVVAVLSAILTWVLSIPGQPKTRGP